MNKKSKTKETQYQDCLDVLDEYGRSELGIMSGQVWHDDPRRLIFSLARYKFVSKMLNGKSRVAEVGCGDGFASRVVKQTVDQLDLYDFDPVFVKDANRKANDVWNIQAAEHDILRGPLPAKYNAIYSLDVMEHIAREEEQKYISNLIQSLTKHGVLIIGMPSLESQTYASPQSKIGHVNCKTGADLVSSFEDAFHHVFLFSMNDEVVHTGFSPMAHYLFALCAEPK